MTANNIGSLLVKQFDEYVGIVTETELARKVLGKGLNRETIGIEVVMSSPVFFNGLLLACRRCESLYM